MTESSLVVRAATLDELEEHFKRSQAMFASDSAPDYYKIWQRNIITAPDHRPEQVRAAILNGKQVGGYIIYEKLLRIGSARLATGCIGVVATDPAYRKQRVATALMQDAIAYAHEHHYPLLLLDGIPRFYYRYGYTDIFDVTNYDIDRQAILALPESSYRVRRATTEDAASIVALYDRHYAAYPGSFVRTVEDQAHRLKVRYAPEDPLSNPLLLAIDEKDQVRGYLILTVRPVQALEFVVDNWEAGSALIRHHAHMMEGEDAPELLTYYLLPAMPIVDQLIDHLEISDTSSWDDPSHGWVIRNQTYHHRFAGWMGRIVDLPALMQAMLPEWQVRWQRSLARWSGSITIAISEARYTLRIDGSELQLAGADSNVSTLYLTSQEFVQILLGYRVFSEVLLQQQQQLSEDERTVLAILFPAGNTWIPRSDWF